MSKTKETVIASTDSSSVAKLSFENAVNELETIINLMESNQLPLEQSLTSYKRGTQLLQFCQKTLADVEQQIRILNESNQLQTYTDNND